MFSEKQISKPYQQDTVKTKGCVLQKRLRVTSSNCFEFLYRTFDPHARSHISLR